jgi:protein SCO1
VIIFHKERDVLLHKWKYLLFSLFVLVGCSSPSTTPQQQQTQAQNDVTALNWQVPSFKAIDQTSKQVTLDTLKGKVWITHFLFTRCPNICPPMTGNLSRVQQELKKAGVPAIMVSFTVDPEYDKPSVLKKFGQDHGADLSNWYFLTGYTFSNIQQISQVAFKGQISKVESDDPKTVLFNHPSQFYLVDQTGKVRKFYDGIHPNVKQIVDDVRSLQ